MAEKKTIGGLGQKTPGQMSRQSVDVKTGKPKAGPSYWQRLKKYATRHERPEREPRTMSERLGQVSRTAQRTFPREPETRPEGIIDIREQAARGKGPALKAQKGTAAAAVRRRRLSLEEKQRKGMRVTGADVPSAVPKAQREVSTKVGEIKRTEGATEGHLGKFVGRGYKPPPPKPKAKPRPRAKPKPTPKKSWLDKLIEGTQKLSAEATADARKYEERKAGKKKDVRKVQKKLEKLPPKPPKRRR